MGGNSAALAVGAAGAAAPLQLAGLLGFTSVGPAVGSPAAAWTATYGGAGEPPAASYLPVQTACGPDHHGSCVPAVPAGSLYALVQSWSMGGRALLVAPQLVGFAIAAGAMVRICRSAGD